MKLRPALKSISAVILLGSIGALLVWAFMEGRKELAVEQERERPIKAPLRVATRDGETAITLDKATQVKSGIDVALLQSISHREEVRAYGTVLQLQELIDLRNAYVTAKAQIDKTRASLEASRREYERLKVLHGNRNISDKTFQSAEAAWMSDEANVRAAQEGLEALGSGARQRWGSVLAKWLVDGSSAFIRLIQQQEVLIQITLPADAHISSAPQTARIQLADGKLASVKLVSTAARTDPRIQGMSFFYLASGKADFLPGMNVVAYLPVGPQIRGVIVPRSAVVWWQGKAWVYVQKAEERFIRHEVSMDMPIENGWFVSEGLSAGDRLVVGGAQLLLSEEFRGQVQVGD